MVYSLLLSSYLKKKLPANLFALMKAGTVFPHCHNLSQQFLTPGCNINSFNFSFSFRTRSTVHTLCVNITNSTSNHHCQYLCHSSGDQRLAKPRVQSYETCVG